MDFSELYTTLLPTVDNIEEQRNSLHEEVNRKIKRAVIFLAVLSLVGGYLAYDLSDMFPVAFMAAFTLMIFGYFIAAGIIKSNVRKRSFNRLSQLFKTKVFSEIVKSFPSGLSTESNIFSIESLKESNLFYIKRNTDVNIRETMIGSVNGKKVVLAHVTTVSYRKESDRGSVDTNVKPYGDRSRQSFSGLVVRLEGIETQGQTYLAPSPRNVTQGMQDVAAAFRSMKLRKDANMSIDEQKSHNLEALRQGMTAQRGFDFRTYMLPEDQPFKSQEIDFGKERDYTFYHQENNKSKILENKKLIQILSMIDESSVQVLGKDKDLLDILRSGNALKNGIAISLHSGKAWAAIPTAVNFDLDLDKPLDQDRIKGIYDTVAAGLILAHILSKSPS